MSNYVGIDIGASGGLAVIGDASHAVFMPMTDRFPDIVKISGFLKLHRPVAVAVELPVLSQATLGKPCEECQFDRPVMSAAAVSRQFMAAGSIMGAVVALGIELVRIQPHAWKKSILLGGDKSLEKAYRKMTRLHPGIDLIPGRCTTPQQGLVHATCLAEYVKRRTDASEFDLDAAL